MDFNIRQEQIKDYEAVHKVVELAFRKQIRHLFRVSSRFSSP